MTLRISLPSGALGAVGLGLVLVVVGLRSAATGSSCWPPHPKDIVGMSEHYIGVNIQPGATLDLFQVPVGKYFILTDIHIAGELGLYENRGGVLSKKLAQETIAPGYSSATGVRFSPGSLVALKNENATITDQSIPLLHLNGYFVDA